MSILNNHTQYTVYHASNVSNTHKKLKEWIGGSLQNNTIPLDNLARIIAADIDILHSAATQNVVDIWHNSQETWPEFKKITSLCHLERANIEILSGLQEYGQYSTKLNHAPLSQIIKSNHKLFRRDANDVILRLSEVCNHLYLRNIAGNCCMQIDVRFILDSSSQINQHEADYKTDSDDDDDDEEYAEQLHNYQQTQESNINTVQSTSNLAANANMHTDDLADQGASIDRTMRQRMAELDCKSGSYKRYEMVIDLSTHRVTTFEAISNETIPSCSVINTPFCRIMNSTHSTQEISNYFTPNGSQKTLLTFSFHVLKDYIQLYSYVAVDDKLYGSRIFMKDLFTTIPLLFEDHSIHQHTKHDEDVRNCVANFKVDDIYNEYESKLYARNANNLDIAIEFVEESVDEWHVGDNEECPINLIMHINEVPINSGRDVLIQQQQKLFNQDNESDNESSHSFRSLGSGMRMSEQSSTDSFDQSDNDTDTSDHVDDEADNQQQVLLNNNDYNMINDVPLQNANINIDNDAHVISDHNEEDQLHLNAEPMPNPSNLPSILVPNNVFMAYSNNIRSFEEYGKFDTLTSNRGDRILQREIMPQIIHDLEDLATMYQCAFMLYQIIRKAYGFLS